MKIILNQNLSCFFLLSFLISIFGCQFSHNDGECIKYIDEKYQEQKIDSVLVSEAYKTHENLLKRFDENSIKSLNFEAYHFIFYSSFGHGKSIKFEKDINSWKLSVKCHSKKNNNEGCKEYQIEIKEEEWNRFEKMIYEYNFWTEENFRANQDVLDGYVYFLEGNRPKAKKCNKKSYNLLGRGSPNYDKIASLCENIMSYNEQLEFRYEQLKKIK